MGWQTEVMLCFWTKKKKKAQDMESINHEKVSNGLCMQKEYKVAQKNIPQINLGHGNGLRDLGHVTGQKGSRYGE